MGDEWNVSETIGVPVPHNQVVNFIEENIILPHLARAETLLEIGAGGGRFTEVLVKHARKVIAADTSPSMLALLRKRFSAYPAVTVLELDGVGLSGIEDHSVDAAFSYDVFVHLSHWHIYLYLEELRRVLRPGGKAVLHHANTFSPKGWDRFLRDAARVSAAEPAQARFTPMTPELMSDLVRRAGLEVERVIEDVIPRDCVTCLRRPAEVLAQR